MDKYVYGQSNILKNKLHIQNEQQLISVEAQLLIAGILELDTISPTINFQHVSSLQKIHYDLFHPIYSWAGEFRSVNIYKSEKVLGNLSITYSDAKDIQSDLEEIFDWSTTIHWNLNNEQLTACFSKFMADLWRVHPYREGNTRNVSIFMKLFANAAHLAFNEQLLSQHIGYLRNALVLATVDESPEPQYLHKIIKDALGLTEN